MQPKENAYCRAALNSENHDCWGFGTVSMLGVRAGRGRNLMVGGFGGYDHGVHRVG
jgi:hypothetical protein